MGVTIVAAVARNGVIGADGGLPWHLPDELRLFKETTLGHVLVMGRRTYESIGRPLPGRGTVVVTRDPAWSAGAEEVVVAHDLDEALERARLLGDEVFVVGGGEVYAAALPRADRGGRAQEKGRGQLLPAPDRAGATAPNSAAPDSRPAKKLLRFLRRHAEFFQRQ